MTTIERVVLILILLLAAGGIAQALPTTGAATLIGSNNATIPVTGITGTEAYVLWGMVPGGEVWITPNWTASGAGAADIQIIGAPMLGDRKYFAKACDSSGCGNEISFTSLPATPITVVTYGANMRNLTATRFNLVLMGGTLFRSYTNLMPTSVMFGLLFGAITIGFWMRTKSVRLISILMIIVSPFIVSSGAGLYLGIPLVEQALGQALLAAGMAGIMLSFVKK
jgi:hypothetical protein